MTSSNSKSWIDPRAPIDRLRLAALVFVLVEFLAIAWLNQPTDLPAVFFFKQDVPILCMMVAAASLFPSLRLGRGWQDEIRLSRKIRLVGAFLVFAIALAGHWLVMLGYDLSRDDSMASFAARQIVQGTLVTPVPAELQPFGHAMLPIFFEGRLAPDLAWASGYLPVNSAVRALAGAIADPAVANPLLLVAGLFALWRVARSIWPTRLDAAVVTVVLAATSSQLIVTAMTSYAMTGHFALNMIWLAFFLRGGKAGAAGALLIAFFAVGLHEIHFHLLFAAPFVLWLAARRQWRPALFYGLGYAALTLFWFYAYPAWLVAQADPAAVVLRPHVTLLDYIGLKLARLFEYSPAVWFFNIARFVAWQNVLLVPLVLSAMPILKTKAGREMGPIVPLAGACVLGLLLMVNQGHGWGYRYLSGDIGCFCLLAGYGWTRAVSRPGAGRAWVALKCACGLALFVTLPVQIAMARSFVAPYAKLYRAAETAPADAILVDISGGFFAQDIVQNSPGFDNEPKLMDLSLVPLDALASLCRVKRVSRIDRRHFRAVGMREGPIGPELERRLEARRALLARLNCAPPLALPAISDGPGALAATARRGTSHSSFARDRRPDSSQPDQVRSAGA